MNKKEKIERIIAELSAAKTNMISALNHNRDLQKQLELELRDAKWKHKSEGQT